MNKLLLKLCFGITLTCLCLVSSAQDPNGVSLPKIIPPGPTSQELQRFLGYSGDGSTGTTNVSIPLYTLNLPGLSIPFSLRYNSSGVKVNQSPGIAGYGWTLFPGLKITRTVMGKSDISFKTNHINQYSQSSSTDNLINIATSAGSQLDLSNTDDGQFDIFTVHLPNYNGSFIIQWNGSAFTAVSIPDSPLQIVPLYGSGSISGFTVTDDRGVVYTFGTDMEFSPDGGDPTAWMLHSITLPGINNTVTFQYVNSLISSPTVAPIESFTIWDNIKAFSGVDGPDGCGFDVTTRMFFPGDLAGASYTTSREYPNLYDVNPMEKALSSVSFSGGSIQFSYQSGNPDPSTAYLQALTVADAASNTVKTINFTVNNHVLQSVAISGEGAYNMQYRPQSAYNIFDQDRWGYFNNKGNNTLVPQMTLNVIQNDLSGVYPTNTVSMTFPGANRTVDTAAMKGNMLQKIIYPTGGWSSFFYEPNAFLHNNTITYGSGLRVSEIDTYDPVSKNTITKTYKYGANPSGQYGGESGLANLGSYPEDDSFIDARELYADGGTYGAAMPGSCRRITINSQSRYRYFNFGTDVWYSQVTEYTSGGGKTIYTYNYTPNSIYWGNYSTTDAGGYFSLGHSVDMLYTLNSLVYSSPDLIKKDIYSGLNGQYTLLKESQYNYSVYQNQGNINGIIVDPMCYIVCSGGGGGTQTCSAGFQYIPRYGSAIPANSFWGSSNSLLTSFFGNSSPFLTGQYTILTGTNALVSTVDIDYANGQTTTVTTNNTYDSTYPFNKTAVQLTTSDGGTLTDNYYYPTSASIPNLSSAQQAAVTTLNNNNRLTTVVEKSSFKGSNPTSGTIFQYKDWGNNIISPELVSTQKGSNPFEPRLQYNGYDSKGNVQSVSKTNGPEICYIYGYGGTYPIAQINNSDYATVQSTLGGQAAVENFRDNTSPTDAAVNAFLAPLRTIAGAQVSTYTYKQLIGMTSATDAKGITTTYEYDSFNRLRMIKNKDGNIVKAFCYNYAGQATNCLAPQPVQPQTIYARIEYGTSPYYSYNNYDDGNYEQETTETEDVRIVFYSDAACTIPYTLTADLTVNVEDDMNLYDDVYGPSTNSGSNTYTVPAGNSSYSLGYLSVYDVRDTYDYNWDYIDALSTYYNYSVITGTGYTPAASTPPNL